MRLEGCIGEAVFLHVLVQDGKDPDGIGEEGSQVEEAVCGHLLHTAKQHCLTVRQSLNSCSVHGRDDTWQA